MTNSDVVSFHNDGNQGSLQATIRQLRQYGRPPWFHDIFRTDGTRPDYWIISKSASSQERSK
jgi:hypothetical protein